MADVQDVEPTDREPERPTVSPRGAKILCWVVIAAFLASAIAVQFIVRLDWGPDEPDHLEYIHELSQGRMPTREQTHQVQHGPVYYALMAGLWRAAGVEQAPMTVPRDIHGLDAMTETAKFGRRLVRAGTALLGCAVLMLLMRIMAVLETPWTWRPWLLVLAAGNPVMQYLGGVVNNEMASILYATIICLFIVRRLKEDRCSVRQAAVLGLLVGGTLLIKRPGLFVAPVALWVLWSVGERSQRLRRFGAFALGAVATGVWWPLRTAQMTGGILGSSTIPHNQPSLEMLMWNLDMVVSWAIALLETALLPAWYWELILRLPVQIIGAVILAVIVGVAVWGLVVRRDRFHYRLRALSVVAMAALFFGIMHYCIHADWRAHMHGRYLINAVPWLICLFAGMRPIIDALHERFHGAGWWRSLREMGGPLFGLAAVVFSSAWWYLAAEFYANLEDRFLK
jgi:hypothetical protein